MFGCIFYPSIFLSCTLVGYLILFWGGYQVKFFLIDVLL